VGTPLPLSLDAVDELEVPAEVLSVAVLAVVEVMVWVDFKVSVLAVLEVPPLTQAARSMPVISLARTSPNGVS
jgi:hypothetical protein